MLFRASSFADASELKLLVEVLFYKESSVIKRCLILWVNQWASRFTHKLNRLHLLVTIRQRMVLARWFRSNQHVLMLWIVVVASEPAFAEEVDQADATDDDDWASDPERALVSSLLKHRHGHAYQVSRVAVIALALSWLTARVAKHLVSIAHNRVSAVALGAAGRLLVHAVVIRATLFVAIQEVHARVVYAAARHALEPERAHILMLFLAMKTNTWIYATEVTTAEGRLFAVLVWLAKAQVLGDDCCRSTRTSRFSALVLFFFFIRILCFSGCCCILVFRLFLLFWLRLFSCYGILCCWIINNFSNCSFSLFNNLVFLIQRWGIAPFFISAFICSSLSDLILNFFLSIRWIGNIRILINLFHWITLIQFLSNRLRLVNLSLSVFFRNDTFLLNDFYLSLWLGSYFLWLRLLCFRHALLFHLY